MASRENINPGPGNKAAGLKKIITGLSYLLLFLLPWQTKLILRPDFSNYNEISLYVWELAALVLVLLFLVYQIVDRGRKIFVAPNLKKIPLYFWLLVILEFFTLLSILVAPDKLLALNYYLIFLLALALFFIIKSKSLNISRLKLSLALLISLSLQAALAISQFLLQTTGANKYLGLAYHNPGAAGTAVIETLSGRWLRAYGGFDHPNILGGVMVLGLILAAFYIINQPRPERGNYLKAKIKLWPTLFLWVFYFLGLAALYFSYSRSAWLAYGGVLALWLLYYIKGRAWPKLSRLIALIILSGVLLLSLNTCFQELSYTRLAAQGRLENKSISERELYLTQAATLIHANFWLGVGRGNYIRALEKTGQVTPATFSQPVHNVYILALAELGVFGFLAFILFFVVYIKKIRVKVLGAGIFLTLIILMAFDHWLFSLPFGIIFFWLLLAWDFE